MGFSKFSSFRKDFYPDNGSHQPIKVERTDSIKEDASRRDFTMNAIYYNINKDVLVDFYHGVVDAKQKILRCINSPEEVLKNEQESLKKEAAFQKQPLSNLRFSDSFH